MELEEIKKRIDQLDLPLEAVKKDAGAAFRKIREQDKESTQEAIVAELLENHYPSVTTRTISRWEQNGIPVENIPLIAKCLDRPVTDFLPILFKSTSKPSNPSTIPGPEKTVARLVHQIKSRPFLFGKKGLVITLLTVFLVIAFGSGYYFLSDNTKVEIIWPLRQIDTNQVDVVGRVAGTFFGSYKHPSIQLFVHPVDGADKYWLNTEETAFVSENGRWHQNCRFGDEDPRTMKKPPPIDFEVYAVLLKKGTKFPLKEGKNHIVAVNEADFIDQIESYTNSISKKYTITRVNPSRPELPVVVSINPPLKVTWPEKVPMFLQIYQNGEVYQEGFFNSGEPIQLPASAILYEIKLSRERGFPQSTQWVLVEEPAFTLPTDKALSYR